MKNKTNLIFKLWLLCFSSNLFAPKNFSINGPEHSPFHISFEQDNKDQEIKITCKKGNLRRDLTKASQGALLCLFSDKIKNPFSDIYLKQGAKKVRVENIALSEKNLCLRGGSLNLFFLETVLLFPVSYLATILFFVLLVSEPFNDAYLKCFFLSLLICLKSGTSIFLAEHKGFYDCKNRSHKLIRKLSLKVRDAEVLKINLGYKGFLEWNEEGIKYLEKLLWNKELKMSLFPEDIKMMIFSFLDWDNDFEYWMKKYLANPQSFKNKVKVRNVLESVVRNCLDSADLKLFLKDNRSVVENFFNNYKF